MRIALSGSFSVGKTTLAQAVFEKATGKLGAEQVSLVEETARKVIAAGFKLDRNGSLDAYLAYISMQLEAERRATTKVVICDRSLADLLAYVRTNDDPNIPASFNRALEEIVRIESRHLDWHCYIPIEFPLVVDDVRPDDLDYQRAVDENYLRVLRDFDLPYVEVRGTIEERVTQVSKLLGI